MLALDSLVIDLIFQADAALEPESLLDALGGREVASTRKLLDPDMQDPRFELELSPSMPFRRRGERRLMIIDDSVAPMREDPRSDLVVPLDLRPEKERLIAACETLPVRLGRLFALGSWGDAVLVARDARDLRGIALLSWVLDPSVDVDGKRRASRLTQAEFEAKILGYEKRLEELDEKEILKQLGTATFERRGDLLVVDVLEPDGTWDLRRSLELEDSLAAVNRFSLIPGAPATAGKAAAAAKPSAARPAAAAKPSALPPAPEPTGPPLEAVDLSGRVVLVFPPDRFDRDVAAALGKRDYETIIRRSDPVPGQLRDRMHRDGAGFVAPLEFLSEVFLEGKPLSRPEFEKAARALDGGVRGLEVHCPRFGPVMLLDLPERGRFISSELDAPEAVLGLLSSR